MHVTNLAAAAGVGDEDKVVDVAVSVVRHPMGATAVLCAWNPHISAHHRWYGIFTAVALRFRVEQTATTQIPTATTETRKTCLVTILCMGSTAGEADDIWGVVTFLVAVACFVDMKPENPKVNTAYISHTVVQVLTG